MSDSLSPDPSFRPPARGLNLAALAAIGLENGPGTEPPPEISGYRLLELLGTGGVGRVYKALHLSSGEMLALKIASTQGIVQVDRMRGEAEILGRLAHPNMVTCRGFGVTMDGVPWLGMDFVDGGSLSMILPASGFSLEEALVYFRPVLAAMMHAHAQGILHRDLKPSNILVSTDGVVKVADFGLARPVEERVMTFSLTLSGVIAGTAEYLAPECYLPGHTAGIASEIYALGVLLHELLTGSPPRGAWAPVSSGKKVDIRVDAFLRRALHPDPAARFASVSEMSAELEKITQSPPRYAGAAFLSAGDRAMDGLWTLLGLVCLQLVITSLLRMGSSRIDFLPLDFFQGDSRDIGTYFTFSVMAVLLALICVIQAARLWRFRRVPLRERLPMPFGLSLGYSRTGAVCAFLGQVCFVLMPLRCLQYLWSALPWTPQPSPWPHLMVSADYFHLEPISIWRYEPGEFLNGNSNWLLDATVAADGTLLELKGKASFFPIVEPLLLGGCVAVIVLVSLWTAVLMLRSLWGMLARPAR